MERAAKHKKEVSMDEALWKSADKLRGSAEPAEYKHVVLSLFSLKFASHKFEAQRRKLIAAGYEAQIEKTFAYTKDNVFYLSPESRWSYIMELALTSLPPSSTRSTKATLTMRKTTSLGEYMNTSSEKNCSCGR